MAVLLVAAACATPGVRFSMAVDALASEDAGALRSYVLLPGNKDVTPDDLEFREYARYVHRVLAARGYLRVDALEQADLVIFLSYGIGDPHEHVATGFVPIFGQTGVLSSTTTGTVTMYGNYGTFSGTTTYTPTYGITGMVPYQRRYTTYFRYMGLVAFDAREALQKQRAKEVWRCMVGSVGTTGHLRVVFPYLAAAAAPYVGTNPGKLVNVVLTPGSRRLKELFGPTTGGQGR